MEVGWAQCGGCKGVAAGCRDGERLGSCLETWHWICPGRGGRRGPSVVRSVKEEGLIEADLRGFGAGLPDGAHVPSPAEEVAAPPVETKWKDSLHSQSPQ